MSAMPAKPGAFRACWQSRPGCAKGVGLTGPSTDRKPLMPDLARYRIAPLAWRLGFLYAALFVVVANECPLPGQAGRASSGLGFPLLTQSGYFTQNPPNMRPNIPGLGAGVGDGSVGDAVPVPLDRKAAGGFRDTPDGGRPAFPSRTTRGMGVIGPAWPNSSCGTASVSVATAPKGSCVGLNASMIALGSLSPAGKPVFKLARTNLIPVGARKGIGG